MPPLLSWMTCETWRQGVDECTRRCGMRSAFALIAAAMSSMIRSGKRTARGVMLEKEVGERRVESGRRGTAREGLTVHLQKVDSERHRQPLQQALACAAFLFRVVVRGPGGINKEDINERMMVSRCWGGSGPDSYG